MNNQKNKKNILNSRRDVLKNMGKATTFIIPTLGATTFRGEPGNPYKK